MVVVDEDDEDPEHPPSARVRVSANHPSPRKRQPRSQELPTRLIIFIFFDFPAVAGSVGLRHSQAAISIIGG
jgi:hypothetical protein